MAWRSRSQYEEIRKIGQGVYGKVVLIRKHVGGSLFALKELEVEQLRRACGTDNNLLQIDLEMAKEKADLMISLQHDHIVRIFGYFKETVNNVLTYHLIMEYCSGGDLESALARQNGPFAEADIQRWARQLALALQFLHENDVCHRYIKTQNIFLASGTERSVVKLGDFGIAETFEQMCRIAPDQPNVFQYCSPEFVKGELYAAPCDVWAFGVVIYRITTNRFPFDVESVTKYRDAVINRKPDPISPQCSIELKEFIQSIFRRTMSHRPNMAAVLRSVFLSNNLQIARSGSFKSDYSRANSSENDYLALRRSEPEAPDMSLLHVNSPSPSGAVSTCSLVVDNAVSRQPSLTIVEQHLHPAELLTAAEVGDLPLIEAILLKVPRSQMIDSTLWKLAEANGADTPLHRAAKRDRLEAMQLLLPTFAPLLTQENSENFAAIHKAAVNNSIRVVKFLIDEKPTLLHLKDGRTGRTPLHHACHRGHLELVKVLIRYPEANVYSKSGPSDDENLPIHLAAEQGHFDCVDYLVQKYPDLRHAENAAGNQPLHIAVQNGQVAIVKYLLDQGVQIDAHGDKLNYCGTALHMAAEKGHLEIVKLLVRNGADILMKSSGNSLGQFYVIHLAAFAGHVGIVEYLLDVKPSLLDAKDSHANRPIHSAANGGQVKVIDLLLRRGAPIDLQHEDMLRTPLHISAGKGHLALADFLIKSGANILAKTSIKDYESLPIHIASYFGNVEVVQLFVEKNAKQVDAKDSQGNRPIHKAALAGKVEVVDFFLKKGISIELRQDSFGRTCLHYAAEEGHLNLVEFLVQNGADVLARSSSDDYTQTPIHLAAEFGHHEVVHFLIKNSPKLVDAVNSEGERPIHRAAVRGQVKVVDVFLKNGVNIEVKDTKCGRTCLHYAALAGQLELVEMLMRKGANVYAQSTSRDDRDMPVHLAAWKGHFDVVRYMVETIHELANVQDGRGRTPLHWAQLSGNLNEAFQIVRWLKGRVIAL